MDLSSEMEDDSIYGEALKTDKAPRDFAISEDS